MLDEKEIRKLNKKLKFINQGLLDAVKEVPDAITKKLAIGANDIRNTIIKSMRNTEKSNVSYKRKNIEHFPSLLFNPPAIDTGELIKSIMFDVGKMEIELGVVAGAPYGHALEFGTHCAPRPFLYPAVKKHEKKIRKSIGDEIIGIFERPFEI